jgi:hypothetical protein
MSTIADYRKRKKDDLINELFNRDVREMADIIGDQDLNDGLHVLARATDKRIPYIGWYWRDTGFVTKQITIARADGGEYDMVGVCESNKWGYPQRWMTEEEVETFIAYLERAMAARDPDDLSMAGRIRAENKVLAEMTDWMQSLVIPDSPW